MKRKALILVAGAAGYVLGARAGRGRYDQIVSGVGRVWGNPKVQQRVTDLQDSATDAAKHAGAVAGDKVSSAASSVAGSVKDKVSSSGSGDGGNDVTDAPLGDQHHTRMPND